jgi:hypothetical protein
MAEEGDFETPRAHVRNQMKREAAAAKRAICEGLTKIEEDQGKEKFRMEMRYSPPKNSDGSTMTYADGSPVVIQVDALPPTMTVIGKILEIIPSARIKSNKGNMEFTDMVSFPKGPDVVKFFDYEAKHRGTGSTKVEIGFSIVSEEDSSYETLKANEEFMQLLKTERVNVFKDKHESFGLAMIGYIFMKSPEATNNKKFERELEYELMKAKQNGLGGKLATTIEIRISNLSHDMEQDNGQKIVVQTLALQVVCESQYAKYTAQFLEGYLNEEKKYTFFSMNTAKIESKKFAAAIIKHEEYRKEHPFLKIVGFTGDMLGICIQDPATNRDMSIHECITEMKIGGKLITESFEQTNYPMDKEWRIVTKGEHSEEAKEMVKKIMQELVESVLYKERKQDDRGILVIAKNDYFFRPSNPYWYSLSQELDSDKIPVRKPKRTTPQNIVVFGNDGRTGAEQGKSVKVIPQNTSAQQNQAWRGQKDTLAKITGKDNSGKTEIGTKETQENVAKSSDSISDCSNETLMSQVTELKDQVEAYKIQLHNQNTVIAKQREDMESMRSSHKDEVTLIKSTHDSVIKEMRESHKEEKKMISESHKLQMAEIRTSHDIELTEIREINRESREEIRMMANNMSAFMAYWTSTPPKAIEQTQGTSKTTPISNVSEDTPIKDRKRLKVKPPEITPKKPIMEKILGMEVTKDTYNAEDEEMALAAELVENISITDMEEEKQTEDGPLTDSNQEDVEMSNETTEEGGDSNKHPESNRLSGKGV